MFNLPLRVLGKTKLSAAASSVTFTLSSYTIPAGTRHLAVIWNAANDTAAAATNIRFNNDSAANYNRQLLYGDGATAAAVRDTGATAILMASHPTGANLFGGGMTLIPHYANTANHKSVLTIGGHVEQGVQIVAGRWANVAAITRIDVLPNANNFVANSIFLLCAVDERFLVEESNLSADGTVTFSAIPQTPGDLVAVGYCRTDRAAATDDIDVSVNSDTTDGNYARQRLSGSSTTTAAAAAADRAIIESVPGDSATANAFGSLVLSISQHANGAKQPHMLAVSGYHESSGPNSNVAITSARRANIAAYTALAFNPGAGGTNFKSGSLFSLYHVPKRLVAYKKLTADAASITHPVPSGFESLTETHFGRGDGASGVTETVDMRFNADTTAANYDVQSLFGNGSTVTAAQSAADQRFSVQPRDQETANVFGGGYTLIPAYDTTDRHKHRLSLAGDPDGTSSYVFLMSSRWENTAAVTQVQLIPNASSNFKGS